MTTGVRRADEAPSDPRADLALSLNNLAVRLGEAGRRADGLTAAQEAVDLHRELAQAEPELYGSAADRAAELVASLAE